jgi:hypothetical protein
MRCLVHRAVSQACTFCVAEMALKPAKLWSRASLVVQPTHFSVVPAEGVGRRNTSLRIARRHYVLIGRILLDIDYMSLIQIKRAVRRLSLGQLKKLDEWLQEFISSVEKAKRAKQALPRKQTVAQQTLENQTYRLENIRCGKEKCKCTRGKLHSPYWYSYTRVKDKVTSQYIGKTLPKDVEKKIYRNGDKAK